jgi:hypothetical protein
MAPKQTKKRTSVDAAADPTPPRRQRSDAPPKSAQLSLFFKSYNKNDKLDFRHFELIKALADLYGPRAQGEEEREEAPVDVVVYPGCHRHATFSLFFPTVLYLDCDKRIGPFYADKALLEYVRRERHYDAEPRLPFVLADYSALTDSTVRTKTDTDESGRRLFVSLSAGPVLENLRSGVARRGDVLLASDAHSEGRAAFVSDDWELIGVWDETASLLRRDAETLARPFRIARTGEPISRAQVEESVRVGAVARRSFRLAYEPMFTLFQHK